MKRLVLLSLVVLTTACAQDMGTASDYPPSRSSTYPRSVTRQSDPLNDVSRQSRSVRTTVQNVMGIIRDIGR
jgi:hypothetical protein